MSFRECVLMMLVVFMSQFQVVKADSGDVFATLLAYVFSLFFVISFLNFFFFFGSPFTSDDGFRAESGY
jgi:hypothetical protein